ncbi:MAG: histidine phosphatase family protein [Planctomycetota bacterium]
MAKPLHAKLVLVSAAGTGWDETGRLLGRSAVVATDTGLTGMHELAGGLSDDAGPVDLVLTAPEDSAKASASLISEAVAAKQRVLDNLANMDLGLWEGTLRAELEGRCPSTYKTWREQPETIRPPEGESLGEALDRAGQGIRRAIEKVKVKPGQEPCVVVVVRSMLWAGLVSRLDHSAKPEFWKLAGQTGSLKRFTIELSQLTPDPASVSA